MCSSQSGLDVFGGAAWQSLLADLEPGAEDILRKFSVRAMLHKVGRKEKINKKVVCVWFSVCIYVYVCVWFCLSVVEVNCSDLTDFYFLP